MVMDINPAAASVSIESGSLGASNDPAVPAHVIAYDVSACIYDERRTTAFRSAIFEVVKPGDVVVDAGSGTGVLGMFAAQAGAERVYCLEYNPELIKIIQANVRENGLEDVIKVLDVDAITFVPEEQADVIISEVISAGFFYEPQIQIVRNLARYLKPDGLMLPSAMSNFVELVDARDELYGLRFNSDSRWCDLEGDVVLSTRAEYCAVEFDGVLPDVVDATVKVRGLGNGQANALRLPYSIRLSQGLLITEPSDHLLNPQIVFLDEPIEVRLGDYYEVKLSYEPASLPQSAEIKVVPITA